MQMIPVTSSDIRSVGYDESARLLRIEFNSGGVYAYFDVPSHLFSSFVEAASKGQFFHSHIKFNYRYQKVS